MSLVLMLFSYRWQVLNWANRSGYSLLQSGQFISIANVHCLVCCAVLIVLWDINFAPLGSHKNFIYSIKLLFYKVSITIKVPVCYFNNLNVCIRAVIIVIMVLMQRWLIAININYVHVITQHCLVAILIYLIAFIIWCSIITQYEAFTLMTVARIIYVCITSHYSKHIGFNFLLERETERKRERWLFFNSNCHWMN